jgi:hypothetical protein
MHLSVRLLPLRSHHPPRQERMFVSRWNIHERHLLLESLLPRITCRDTERLTALLASGGHCRDCICFYRSTPAGSLPRFLLSAMPDFFQRGGLWSAPRKVTVSVSGPLLAAVNGSGSRPRPLMDVTCVVGY